MVLEKTLESPLDCKEIQPVNPKGYQSWIFIGRTDAIAEAPILWPPDAKNWLIRKDADAGKDWRQEEKGITEDEMVGWHHWLGGHEFEQAPGVGDGQGSLVCCSLWVSRESDTIELLNWGLAQNYTEKLLQRSRVFSSFISLEQRTFNKLGIHFFRVTKEYSSKYTARQHDLGTWEGRLTYHQRGTSIDIPGREVFNLYF